MLENRLYLKRNTVTSDLTVAIDHVCGTGEVSITDDRPIFVLSLSGRRVVVDS